MIVMPSNNSGRAVRDLLKRHPGRIGWLIGPGGWRMPPPGMPVALDNGAFPAFTKRKEWDEKAWWKLIQTACGLCPPIWAVVPDVVADRDATLASWERWAPVMRAEYPTLPLALAVQDGMTPADVPEGVHTIFVGGSTQWKWRTAPQWTAAFPRVHIARVNSERLLWISHRAGAVSCDGTGWTRGGARRIAGLENYLRQSSSPGGHPQMVMEGFV